MNTQSQTFHRRIALLSVWSLLTCFAPLARTAQPGVSTVATTTSPVPATPQQPTAPATVLPPAESDLPPKQANPHPYHWRSRDSDTWGDDENNDGNDGKNGNKENDLVNVMSNS